MKRKIHHRNIEFVIDNSHYFIPLNLIKAFSSTIREKAQNKNFNLFKFVQSKNMEDGNAKS